MPAIVKYGRLINLGNYENERLELEDCTQPGETPEQAYARVRAWVHAQLRRDDLLADLEKRLARLTDQINYSEVKARNTEQRWAIAAERYNELRELLERHGAFIDPLPASLTPDRMKPIVEEEEEEEVEDPAF